jgi:UDP-sulfoquinovose synthase
MTGRVLVLGGDGYLGWPTSMYLSAKGYNVMAVDNYARRNWARECNAESLIVNPILDERVDLWKKSDHSPIEFAVGDLNDWTFVEKIFKEFKPDTIIHYAEQPSAPFSMMGRREATATLNNNLNVTLNMIYAVKEFCPEAHIVKLGTMGEYGTPNIDIEEGWLEVDHNGRKQKFLYPRQAGSLYHTTKVMDTDLLWLYVRTWGLRVTDLMQGPVYGIKTYETGDNLELAPSFHYDHIFGTVLNRFVVQAVAGVPLTVYGKGGQKRGFLNIKDTMACIGLAVQKPAKQGELRVLNQFTEVFSVNELADKVQSVGDKMGLKVEIQSIKNPRLEAEDHYYNAKNTGLMELGLEPHLLTDDALANMLETVTQLKGSIKNQLILPSITWK